MDYYLTQVEKPLNVLDQNEQLEAVQIPSSEIHRLMELRKKEESSLDFYLIEKVIGKGGFSKVLGVRHKLTGQIWAMKTLRKDKLKEDNKVA